MKTFMKSFIFVVIYFLNLLGPWVSHANEQYTSGCLTQDGRNCRVVHYNNLPSGLRYPAPIMNLNLTSRQWDQSFQQGLNSTLGPQTFQSRNRVLETYEQNRMEWEREKAILDVQDQARIKNYQEMKARNEVKLGPLREKFSSAISDQNKLDAQLLSLSQQMKDWKASNAYGDQRRDNLDQLNQMYQRATPGKVSGKTAKLIGLESIRLSDAAIDRTESDSYYHVATSLLDIALGLTPLVGEGKDLYEAITGSNLLTGEHLTSFERGMAVVGVVTLGTSGVFKYGGKFIDEIIPNLAKRLSFVGHFRQAENSLHESVRLSETILESTEDIIKHSPINPGQLHQMSIGNMRISDTFRSGTYVNYTNKKSLKLYRVYSGSDELGHVSKFWSKTKPNGPFQAMIDNALDPSWGNRAIKWIEIEVPAGQKISEGVSASIQRIGNNISEFTGGGSQIYLDFKIPDNWISLRGVF